MNSTDTRNIERAAAALDGTHQHDNRGPKTVNARERVAAALDKHIVTGRKLTARIMTDVRHLEFVIRVETARATLATLK